ncbi:MAG: GNAT family N-acetyltransferase, partial [Acidobacteriota bacterium]|nr:GNAT family N-acetyltransferase [Acidobacteriota bacterium]
MITREYNEADEPAVLELLQTVFGSWPRGIEGSPAEFFRWKHLHGPHGCSALFVAECEGVLAGFVAYMPWRLRVDGERVSALRGVDLAVHPQFRRRGVSQALRVAADSLLQGAFIWASPNDPAHRGGVKHGRRSGGRIPPFARFCGRISQSARRTWRGDPDGTASLPVRAPEARETLADDEYVSRLFASVPHPAGRLSTDRDVSYLRWRYAHFPEYRAVVAGAEGGAGGIAIFRPRRYGRFWVLDVSELLAEGAKTSVQRQLLAQLSKAAAADFLVCNFRSRRQAALHGFLQASRGVSLYTRIPDGGRVVVDPTGSGAWALSRGDL